MVGISKVSLNRKLMHRSTFPRQNHPTILVNTYSYSLKNTNNVFRFKILKISNVKGLQQSIYITSTFYENNGQKQVLYTRSRLGTTSIILYV